MLFDKESPNLYREPLVSMQLTQRSLEKILSRSNLPTTVVASLNAFKQDCVQQIEEVRKAIDQWHQSEAGQDRSPWGVSGRKPVFEVLYQLASGSSLSRPTRAHEGLTSNDDKSEVMLDFIHDTTKVHPVIIEAGQHDDMSHRGRLFLIE